MGDLLETMLKTVRDIRTNTPEPWHYLIEKDDGRVFAVRFPKRLPERPDYPVGSVVCTPAFAARLREKLPADQFTGFGPLHGIPVCVVTPDEALEFWGRCYVEVLRQQEPFPFPWER